MLVHSDSKSKSIDEKLIAYFSRSWNTEENHPFNSVSCARTENREYYSGKWGSKTHLLTHPSELGAILHATSALDPKINEIITMVNQNHFTSSIIPLLESHAARTGNEIQYRVYTREGNKLVNQTISPHHAFLNPSQFWKEWSSRPFSIPFEPSKPLDQQLYDAAIAGMRAHFGTKEKFTHYGAAVKAGERIYFTGVYSNPDERMGMHPEMGAALLARMDGQDQIDAVGVVSEKFVDKPTSMCGLCRQTYAEIVEGQKQDVKLFTFSFGK